MLGVKLNREQWRNCKTSKDYLEKFIVNIIRVTADDTNDATTHNVMALVCIVLRDKYGFGGQRLRRLLVEVTRQAEAVNSHMVRVSDIIAVLQEEVPDIATFWPKVETKGGEADDTNAGAN